MGLYMKWHISLLLLLTAVAPICAGKSSGRLGPQKTAEAVTYASVGVGVASAIIVNKYTQVHPGICTALAGAVTAVPMLCSDSVMKKAAISTSKNVI